MGLLPDFGGLKPVEVVQDFLAALHAINHKLDTLIELQRDQRTADRLAAATAQRGTIDGMGGHETNDHGDVTWCPIFAATGERREHQVRRGAIGDSVIGLSCHPQGGYPEPPPTPIDLNHGKRLRR